MLPLYDPPTTQSQEDMLAKLPGQASTVLVQEWGRFLHKGPATPSEMITALANTGASIADWVEFLDLGEEILQKHVGPGEWDGKTKDLRDLKRVKTPDEIHADAALEALSTVAVDADQATEDQFPKPELLVEDLLYADSVVTFVGPSKAGKTYCMLDAVNSWRSGADWLGLQATRPLSVLYIDGEMPMWSLIRRMNWIRALRQSPPGAQGRMWFCPLAGTGLDGSQVAPAVRRGFIKRLCGNTKPDLIVVDNLSALAPVDAGWYVSEGDDRTMEHICRMWAEVQRLANCAMLLVHHTTKGSQEHKTVMDMGSGSGVLGRRSSGQMAIRQVTTADGEEWRLEIQPRHFAPKSITLDKRGALYHADTTLDRDIDNLANRQAADSPKVDRIYTVKDVRVAYAGESLASLNTLANRLHGTRKAAKLDFLAGLVHDGILVEDGQREHKGSVVKLYRLPPETQAEMDMGGAEGQAL